jgi:hypothetical protein
MTPKELLKQDSNAPVRCADGKIGLLIRWWGDDAGIQVPGEPDIRRVRASELYELGGGALGQR